MSKEHTIFNNEGSQSSLSRVRVELQGLPNEFDTMSNLHEE